MTGAGSLQQAQVHERLWKRITALCTCQSLCGTSANVCIGVQSMPWRDLR